MRIFLVIALAVMLSGALVSCFDPQPGEISVIATKSGQRASCGIKVFNAKGAQIDQVFTDMQGLVYIKGVKPGKYTLEFVDKDGNKYPPVLELTIDPGEQETVRVDLDKETVDAAAPAAE